MDGRSGPERICPLFDEGAIDLVQFEYGQVSILNRFLLADFYKFFRERYFVVGKIFSNHVDFHDHDLSDENFVGPNYLACRRSSPDLVQALSGFWL